MPNFSINAINRQFDFRLAGRWLILGSVVGIVSGLGAILFQSGLSLLQELTVVHWMGLSPGSAGGESPLVSFVRGPYFPVLILIIPAAGGLLSGWLVYTFAPEAEGHGTDAVINSYHRQRGIINPKVPLIKLFASIITIGTGGSGGREGPIAQIGSGFGSFLATRMGLNTRTRRWLLAAGMGAGIGSIFRAPLAGALFAAEVLYSDPEVESEVLLPATVASIIAYSVFSLAFGWGHMFIASDTLGFSNPLELIPYLLMAVVLALAALFYVKIFYGINKLFKSLKIPNMFKPAIGGLLTGITAFALITAFNDRTYVVDVMSGGYGIIQEVLSNGLTHVSIIVLLVIGASKILTTSFSIGSGGSAGVFGPSMVIGGALGTAMGYIFQMIAPDLIQHPAAFTIVGMAGFFAAAANTPLSTIIMVSELTGNYELLMPTMWVCSISFLVAKKWSIYQSQVPNHNFSQAHFGKMAPDILNTTRVADAFKRTRNFTCVPEDCSIEDIYKIVDESRQRIFPVIDKKNDLIGAFNIEDVTHLLQEPAAQLDSVTKLMHTNIATVTSEDMLQKAYALMRDNFTNEILVVSEAEKPQVLGIITSADITLTYNRKLSEIKFGETHQETVPGEGSLVQQLSLRKLIEKDLLPVRDDAMLGDLVQLIVQSKRNLFPVLDKDAKLVGIVMLSDVRKIMFDKDQYDTLKVGSLMKKVPDVIFEKESMNKVFAKFEKTGAWNLPVVKKSGKYVGMISKSRIFSSYRHALIHSAEL